MNAEIRAKLFKLKKLAEKGYYGEAENAKKLLQKLIKKYNIDEYELDHCEEQPIVEFGFGYKNDIEYKILCQIIWMVTNRTNLYTKHWKSNNRQLKKIFMECTKRESIEIQMLFDFYTRVFYQEQELFLSAFISKHNLYGKDEDNSIPVTKRSMEEYLRMASFENGMKDATPLKQIKEKN